MSLFLQSQRRVVRGLSWWLGGTRGLSWWLGGTRRLSTAGTAERTYGKEANRKAKYRIDNLADMNELRRTGGKKFEAHSDLLPVEECPLFPTITGSTLSGSTVTLPGNLFGNVTLMTVSMRVYGERHCEQYSKPYRSTFGRNPAASVFELCLVDVWIYRKLSRWMIRNRIKTMSHDRQECFMLYTEKNVSEIRKILQLDNSLIGYVFLLDSEGRIRWRAHASPTKHETTALLNCTRQLLDTLP